MLEALLGGDVERISALEVDRDYPILASSRWERPVMRTQLQKRSQYLGAVAGEKRSSSQTGASLPFQRVLPGILTFPAFNRTLPD